MKHPPFWTRVAAIGTKTLELTRMVSQLAAEIFRSDIRIRNATKRPSHVIPGVTAWVLATAGEYCEACGNQAPFCTDDGSPFLEVHQVKMLADGGSDQITIAVALCPNCHRRFHHSADREAFVTSMYQRVRRLIRQ
jgi:predicted HNH restriction endonuclease